MIDRKQSIKLVKKAWGKGFKIAPVMGPFETSSEVDAEACIHEMAHAVLLGMPLKYGKMFSCIDNIENALDNYNTIIKELHEVRALGAEFLVVRDLGFQDVTMYGLAYLGSINLSTKPSTDIVERIVNKAMRTKKVKAVADRVLAFIKKDIIS